MNKDKEILDTLNRIADVLEFAQEMKWGYISQNKRKSLQELKEKVK